LQQRVWNSSEHNGTTSSAAIMGVGRGAAVNAIKWTVVEEWFGRGF